MSNELKKHKRSDTVKWVIVFVCIALLTVAVIAALTRGFTDPNPYGWLDKHYEFKLYEDDAKDSPKESIYAAVFDGELDDGKDYTFDVKFVYTDEETESETITFSESATAGTYTSEDSTYTFTLKTDTAIDFNEDTGYKTKEGSHLLIFNDYVDGADESVKSATLMAIAEVK